LLLSFAGERGAGSHTTPLSDAFSGGKEQRAPIASCNIDMQFQDQLWCKKVGCEKDFKEFARGQLVICRPTLFLTVEKALANWLQLVMFNYY
jgi:hypothetical protein